MLITLLLQKIFVPLHCERDTISFTNIGCVTPIQQGQSHPYSDMGVHSISTCHNDGLGIVVPISDTWYNMYMLPEYAIVKKSSNIMKF